MALIQMAQELTGRVPNLDIDLAVTMIREARKSVRKLRGWSFQLGQGGFAAPSKYGLGTGSRDNINSWMAFESVPALGLCTNKSPGKPPNISSYAVGQFPSILVGGVIGVYRCDLVFLGEPGPKSQLSPSGLASG